MSKKLVCITIIIFAVSVPSAAAKSSRHPQRMVLLPVEQANIAAGSKLSDQHLAKAVLVQLTRLKNLELAEFTELSKALDKQLVDDAVFELLVTDDLKQTLAKLNALQTRIAKLTEYCKVAKDTGIDYLVDVSIEQHLTQLGITYSIIDTKTRRVSIAKSFYEVPNDPIGVSDEIAKRAVRSLWQWKHNK